MTYDPILIAKIRQIVPNIIASEIANVQPIASNLFSIDTTETKEPISYPFGTLVHNFVYGWLVEMGDGKQVYLDEFLQHYPPSCLIGRKWTPESLGY